MDGTNKVIASIVAILAAVYITYRVATYKMKMEFEEKIPTAAGGVNNPGNIEKPNGRDTFRGEIVAENDSRFTSFKSMAYGYRAIKKILKTKYGNGMKTLRDMIASYAPADDGNNVSAYVSWVANAANVDADKDLNNYSDQFWENVVRAIGAYEQGQTWTDQYAQNTTSWVHEGFLMA